jgi:hypothetical protein
MSKGCTVGTNSRALRVGMAVEKIFVLVRKGRFTICQGNESGGRKTAIGIASGV